MPYPDRLLAEDEEVVLDLHPHWKALVIPVLVLLATLAVTGFAVAAMPDGDQQGAARVAVIVVALAVIGWFVVRRWLQWRTTHFIVTTHRVLIRKGILARSGRDVPLSRVNDVTFSHSVFERVLGCGTLVIESAGERGQVTLTDVPHVEEVQRTLYQLAEDDDARRRGVLADDEP